LGIDEYVATPDEIRAASLEEIAVNGDHISNFMNKLGVESTTSDEPTGFSGAVVNPATAEVDIWWSGEVPSAVAELASAQTGIAVAFHRAAHSRQELMLRIEKAHDQMVGVDQVIPKEDGSGIVVTHDPSVELDVESLVKLLGVPVTTIAEPSPVDLNNGRQTDDDPRFGGAMIINEDDGVCSTGFAVLASGNEGRILSAAHCDLTGNKSWDNGDSQNYTSGGGNVSVALSVDSMLIDPIGGTNGRVYDGGIWGSSSRKVAGTDVNNVGDFVRMSGANSGENSSGIEIINDSYSGDCNGYACTLIVAEANQGQVAGIRGDSGGPVYHVRGEGRVDAKGIILQGSQDVQCNNYRFDPSKPPPNADTGCFNRVRYQPIRPLMSVWNVSIETQN
jgi:hypothetical protein